MLQGPASPLEKKFNQFNFFLYLRLVLVYKKPRLCHFSVFYLTKHLKA